MANLKKAKLVPFVIDVICPHCHEPVHNPEDGSFMWEVSAWYCKSGEVYECPECNKEFVMPITIKGRI